MISVGNIPVVTNIDQSHKQWGPWFYPIGDTYKAGMVQAGDKFALDAGSISSAIATAPSGKPTEIVVGHAWIFSGQ